MHLTYTKLMGLFRLPHAPAFTQATNLLMFVQSMKFIKAHSGRNDNVFIFGQKSNLDTWKMAKINMAIRGIEANLGVYSKDTFVIDLQA